MAKNVLGIFGESDIEGITTLIKQMEKSPFDYLKLEGDGMKVVIGKHGVMEVSDAGSGQVEAPRQTEAYVAVPQAVQETVSTAGTVEPAVEAAAVAGVPDTTILEGPGIFVVKSPSYGMYYAQREPGAPPYVEVGKTVQKGETIGLLEIMKTFNAIVSEVDGEVLAVYVKNEEVLEPGQPLVSIRVA